MGGEREPVMLSTLLALITGIVGAVSFAWLVVAAAALFWFGAVWMFRRMGKADPIMSRVWRRHVGYRHYYPAGSSVWASSAYKMK
jgi:type IV secretory pathway TrbD component